MNTKKQKVLLIIPAYNEEESILNGVNKIYNYNKENNTKYDIVVINDGSKDNTEKILCENNINHIKLINNLGIGGAVQTGYKYALENDYDIAVQFDGDGQHDIRYVRDVIKPITDNDANMVIGSRFIDKSTSKFKSSKARQMGIKMISFFIKLVTSKKIYDTTSGFRAVDKELIKKFSNSYPVEYPEPVSTTEILKMEYKVKEVAVSMNERENGISSIRMWKNCYYMINVILYILVIGIRRYKK
ncbi:MAG: glycosyl transferase family 2 [Firmicutes bacterium CAG:321_26_22]|nr:MAG: glycosyl transferase family 2 [Firmicutes bacterium CAG:321_26_22]